MSEKAAPGLFKSLRLTLADLIESGRTRLLLLANEVEEAKLRLVAVLVCAVLAFAFVIIGAVLLAFFFVFLFWESRILVLGAACGAFFVIAALLALIGRSVWKGRTPLFSASLAELKTDVERLRATSPETSG